MAYDSKGTVNKVILIGRLGADPELKYTQANAAVLNLRLATNTSWKGQDGNLQESTEWHNVVVWRKTAEVVSKYTKKGSRIYVEGKLTTRSWDDKDGNKRYTTEVLADQIQLLDTRGDRDTLMLNLRLRMKHQPSLPNRARKTATICRFNRPTSMLFLNGELLFCVRILCCKGFDFFCGDSRCRLPNWSLRHVRRAKMRMHPFPISALALRLWAATVLSTRDAISNQAHWD
jgi:single-strand DNA-binding protein